MSANGASGSAPGGLRERSKARRRTAIQHTAMRMFAERGYDATTIADIADAAEVAPRTVSGYFPSKVDLATSFADEIADRITATIAAHPDADFLTVLDTWLTRENTLMDRETAALADAMYEANPALRALGSAHVAQAVEVAGVALAAQLGLSADDPMASIVGDALGAAITAYLAVIWHNDDSPHLHQSAMAFMRSIVDSARPSQAQAAATE
jgi:AcrR family transcriptional regulator